MKLSELKKKKNLLKKKLVKPVSIKKWLRIYAFSRLDKQLKKKKKVAKANLAIPKPKVATNMLGLVAA